jgi:hypothetical protein
MLADSQPDPLRGASPEVRRPFLFEIGLYIGVENKIVL